MNVLIFAGFLGSGKTSLILSLAHFIVGKGKNEARPHLVIIENEIGETGIDDKLLKTNGFSVRELFSGCICCTLAGELTITLNDISKTINPEWVIIECSGLAYPAPVVGMLEQCGKGIAAIRAVTVVDAERWEELLDIIPVISEKQVVEADTILINKIDLLGPHDLEKVEWSIAGLNSRARIFKVSAKSEIKDNLWSEVTKIHA